MQDTERLINRPAVIEIIIKAEECSRGWMNINIILLFMHHG